MKPELKVLSPEDAPKPPQDAKQSPAQAEMPFRSSGWRAADDAAAGPLYSTARLAGLPGGI